MMSAPDWLWGLGCVFVMCLVVIPMALAGQREQKKSEQEGLELCRDRDEVCFLLSGQISIEELRQRRREEAEQAEND